jgi:hypothetical protein
MRLLQSSHRRTGTDSCRGQVRRTTLPEQRWSRSENEGRETKNIYRETDLCRQDHQTVEPTACRSASDFPCKPHLSRRVREAISDMKWRESKCGDEASKSGMKWNWEWSEVKWSEVKVLSGMCVLSLIYSYVIRMWGTALCIVSLFLYLNYSLNVFSLFVVFKIPVLCCYSFCDCFILCMFWSLCSVFLYCFVYCFFLCT